MVQKSLLQREALLYKLTGLLLFLCAWTQAADAVGWEPQPIDFFGSQTSERGRTLRKAAGGFLCTATFYGDAVVVSVDHQRFHGEPPMIWWASSAEALKSGDARVVKQRGTKAMLAGPASAELFFQRCGNLP